MGLKLSKKCIFCNFVLTSARNLSLLKLFTRVYMCVCVCVCVCVKTVPDQPDIAKDVAYGLPFYGIVWMLVRQGPFID